MSEKKPFIKILDESVANELCKKGFMYLKETMNKKTIYVFPFDQRIIRILQRQGINFSSDDNASSIICDSNNTLRF